MPDLTFRAIALQEEGRTTHYDGNDLGVALSIIFRLWKRRRETEENSRKSSQDRKRKTTRLQVSYIVNCALRKCTITARHLQNTKTMATCVEISVGWLGAVYRTVRKRLTETNFR